MVRIIITFLLLCSIFILSTVSYGGESSKVSVFFEERGTVCDYHGIGFSQDGLQIWTICNPNLDQNSNATSGMIDKFNLSGDLVDRIAIESVDYNNLLHREFLFISENEITSSSGIVFKKINGAWNQIGSLIFPLEGESPQIQILFSLPGTHGYLARVNRWLYLVDIDHAPIKLGSVFFYGMWAPPPVPDPRPAGVPYKPESLKNEPLDEDLFHVRTFGTNGIISYPRGYWKQLIFQIDANGSLNALPEIPFTVECKSFHISENGQLAGITSDTPQLLWTRNCQIEKSIPLPDYSGEVTWLPSMRIIVEDINKIPVLTLVDPESGDVSEPLVLPGSKCWIRIHPRSGAILASTEKWSNAKWWFIIKESLRSLDIVNYFRTPSPVTCIVPDEDRNRIFTMQETGEIRILKNNEGIQIGWMQAGVFRDSEQLLNLFSEKPVDQFNLDESSSNRWYSLAISPDGKILIAGSDNGRIDIIDTANSRNHTYRYFDGVRVNGIQFLAPIKGGYRVALFDRSWRLRIIDVFQKEIGFYVKRAREITGNFGFAYGLARCSINSRFGAVACSYWRGIRAVDFETGIMRFVDDVPGPGHGVAAIPGSKYILGAYNSKDDGFVIIKFDPENGQIALKINALNDMTYGALAASSEWWAACTENNNIRVGRLSDKPSIQEIEISDTPPDECAQCIAFLKDGSTLLVGTVSGRVLKIDLQ